jgi:hypothetical protein
MRIGKFELIHKLKLKRQVDLLHRATGRNYKKKNLKLFGSTLVKSVGGINFIFLFLIIVLIFRISLFSRLIEM